MPPKPRPKRRPQNEKSQTSPAPPAPSASPPQGGLSRHTAAAMGAVAAMLVGAVLLVVLAAGTPPLGAGFAFDTWAGLRPAIVQSVLLALAAYVLLRLVFQVPLLPVAGIVGILLVVPSQVAHYFPPSFTRGYVALLLLLLAWLGASAGSLVASWRLGDGARRRWALLNALAVLGVVGVAVALLAGEGEEGSTLRAIRLAGPPAAWLAGPSPAAPGHHQVQQFTYGTGTVRGRTEYGPGARIRSTSVDLTPSVTGFGGRTAARHAEFWGFPLSVAPLNAHVWMPAEEGRYPLVLALPGRHASNTESELGLGYLGTLLASRGFVFVAIDQSFLNGPWIANGSAEMAARAHLALHHLGQLRAWAGDEDSPFHGRLDLDRVALLGHSRGGEAAATAAVLNSAMRLPENANFPLRFGFGIRAVVAFAPTDGLYRPSGREVAPTGIDYLVLHGSLDGDISAFHGMSQYQRVRIPPGSDHFKAAVYVHRANHVQFNERWGSGDHRAPLGWLLNREPLLPADSQRHVAALYTSAFLEASLRGQTRYVSILRDERAAGDWLPSTLYLTRYEDGRTRLLSAYEEDGDPTTTTVEGGWQRGMGLAQWRELPILFRDRGLPPQENHAVLLAWTPTRQAAQQPRYEIALPPEAADTWGMGPATHLVFAAANAAHEGGAIDLSLELETDEGVRARLPITPFGVISPPLLTHVWKADFLNRRVMHSPEMVLDGYEVPLAEFVRVEPDFDPTRVRIVRFLFDRTPMGSIFLDDVGFRTPWPGEEGWADTYEAVSGDS